MENLWSQPASGPALGPGKQTRTRQLDVHAAAAHGVAGSGTTLPYLDQIQRSFGRHDVGDIQAHIGGPAAEGAGAMGADAFATGNHVAFAGAPDLHTAAHEAAHIVQQRGGVQLHGGVGAVGDPYEQHADAVADLVVQGKSSEALLDHHAGGAAASSATGPVQRHAFINGKQVKKTDAFVSGPLVDMVTDLAIRDYQTVDEMKNHAAGATDYLGNLPDGTWLRFSPIGTNLLGEMHTATTLQMVAPAVGSKSFIYEPFSNDDLAAGSDLKTAYDDENAGRFKAMGVDGVADKKQFGAESLLPKIGFGLTLGLPYLEGKQPLANLTKASGIYDGQPIQRYVKLGWAHAKDSVLDVAKRRAAKQPVPPKLDHLADVVMAVAVDLDPFLTGLAIDGWLGDELVKKANHPLIAPLTRFVRAAIDAMVELAIADPSNRIDDKQKKKFAGKTSNDDQNKMFNNWRNFKFEESMKDAVGRGVRYAGMGAAHLYHLRDIGLPPNTHDFDMSGTAMIDFEDQTEALKKIAVKP